MLYTLKPYQSQAAQEVAAKLVRAMEGYRASGAPASLSLTAITSAGKTVIAAAVIEALFYGSADLDITAEPDAVVLWVTDDPPLNAQTKHRMSEASDRLDDTNMEIVNGGFDQEVLDTSRLYFLNVQKLGSTSSLVKAGNQREHTFWQTLANTVAHPGRRLYLVLDEAHRGMKQDPNRSTIVQRIINGTGDPGAAPSPVPVVWGISATSERFVTAMSGISGRDTLAAVEVSTEQVRASGLLKRQVALDPATGTGELDITLLRAAVASFADYTRRWRDYATAQGSPPVDPLMVVQVADKTSSSVLAELVETIEDEWTAQGEAALGPFAFANVFGDHEDLQVAGRTVAYVAPETIQDSPEIRVLLAKNAVSTGWDCPRAEVMYSQRPAKDKTHIAQLLGRMVRAPLGRAITTDDTLNSVAAFLPKFDRTTLETVIGAISGKGAERDEELAVDIITAKAALVRNPAVPPEVFVLAEMLPCLPAPAAPVPPVTRARNLAANLSQDALVPDAGRRLDQTINAALRGYASQHEDELAAATDGIVRAQLNRTTVDLGTGERETAAHYRATDEANIEDAYRSACRRLPEGVVRTYWEHLQGAFEDISDDQLSRTRAVAAALAGMPGVPELVDQAAAGFITTHRARARSAIASMPEEKASRYRAVDDEALEPEERTFAIPTAAPTSSERKKGEVIEVLPTLPKHLLATDTGDYPVSWDSSWEADVVVEELANPELVGWYRNPSRSGAHSLSVAYWHSGRWKSMQPDFVFFTDHEGELKAHIVDPHGDHLAEAVAKLKGLAAFAGSPLGEHYGRIDAITRLAGGPKPLRVLDLKVAGVREAVLDFAGDNVSELYTDDALAVDYAFATGSANT